MLQAGRQYRMDWGEYFCGANGGKVFRMREQNSPAISDEIVKPDVSLSGVCFEIRGSTTQPQFLLFNTVNCTSHFNFFLARGEGYFEGFIFQLSFNPSGVEEQVIVS